MACFDYEVCYYFVEDSDCFGERGGDVAEGIEKLFYCSGFYKAFRGFGRKRVKEKRGGEGNFVLSVSKFRRPLWRAARARTSVMFFLKSWGCC